MAGGEGGVGPISVRNNKQRSLGPEWSMSEVGTPPPHNPDKPHRLVDSINNKKIYTFEDTRRRSNSRGGEIVSQGTEGHE